MLLDRINKISDIKKFSIEELNVLRDEIANLIIRKCSLIGGHLGSNLGVIELTIALYYVFDFDNDKLIFDVSHQSYTHKILSGRKDNFIDEDKYLDISGFTSFEESKYDIFKSGHTSSSIALSLGIAKSRDLQNKDYKVIDVIGDGSLSGGLAFEGLNNISKENDQFLLIVNDNEMSIEENQGGIYESLRSLRESKGNSSNNIFKCFGIDYIYEENGNNIESLINILNKIKDNKKPIVLHIHTLKGNGYEYAYLNKEKYHYALPFNVKNGEFKNDSSRMEYGEISYQFLSSLMDKDKNVVVLTSAVAYLCNFNKERREKYKDQFIDVGIAEAFGVSFLSGLGKGNTKVYYPVTCSFLQRGYDSLIEDFALNEIDSTILLCFGSLYSSKDVTHIGIFDEIMLSNIPNLIYLDPTSYEEYISMLEYSYKYKHGPLVIRVPNKIRYDNKKDDSDYSILNKSKIINEGKDIAIFYVGNLEFLAEEIKDEFLKQDKNITLIRQRFLSGIDKELINRLINNHKVIITLEDTILDAGFGNKISSYLGNKDIYVLNYGLKKEFIDRYDINQLLKDNHLNKDSIILDINKLIK